MRTTKILFLSLLLGNVMLVYALSRISVGALVENPSLFDGKIVEIEGELVGDIIESKDGFWVNVLDSKSVIGVWCLPGEKEKIKFLGRYGIKGDYVRVKGVFHKECVQHTGDRDIHAGSIDILKQGHKVSEEIPLDKVLFAIFLGVVSLSAIGILHLLSRRESHSRS